MPRKSPSGPVSKKDSPPIEILSITKKMMSTITIIIKFNYIKYS